MKLALLNLANWKNGEASPALDSQPRDSFAGTPKRRLSAAELRQQLGFADKFVISYVGTLGLAHGLSLIVETAERLRRELPAVHFLVVGEGADKERILALAAQRQLTNITLLPQQPREQIPAVICASDICLVLLKKAAVFETVIPTKMLEFMACGRPIILGVDGQARQIMDEAQAGIFTEPENPEALFQAIERLYLDSPLRETLGRNGRMYIVRRLSRASTAATYSNILQAVIDSGDKRAKGSLGVASNGRLRG